MTHSSLLRTRSARTLLSLALGALLLAVPRDAAAGGVDASTFFGGTNDEFGWDLVALPDGDVVICGVTTSNDLFPAALGAYQPVAPGGASDVYVAQFSGDGATLRWATYLGGSDGEGPFELERTSTGDLVIVGGTRSQDFPTTPGAYQTAPNGSFQSAFLTVLDAGGATLKYSTYLGGSADDWALDAELGPNGFVTLIGVTNSLDFPVTAGAFQTAYQGGFTDAWVARLNPVGGGASDLVWSSYLGGQDVDGALENQFDLVTMAELAIRVGATGETTILGRTLSHDFPTTPGAFQTLHQANGKADAFVARLANDGGSLQWSTFLGGTGEETAGALHVDDLGRVTVTGSTDSADFPTTAGAFDGSANGGFDGFVARLDGAGSTLQYATYLGGSADDDVLTSRMQGTGTMTLVLRTWSADFPLPLGAADTVHGGNFLEDAALCRFRADGGGASDLHYATFVGGSFNDDLLNGEWDGVSAFTAVGFTTSLFDYPVTPGAWSPFFSGGFFDSVLTRVELLPTGVEVIGAPTQDCAGREALGVRAMAYPGSASFALVGGGPPSAAGFLVLSFGGLAAPVKVLATDFWLDPTQLLPLVAVQADPLGAVVTPLPIPNNQAAVGLSFHAQYLWASGCAPYGASATNAVKVTIQP